VLFAPVVTLRPALPCGTQVQQPKTTEILFLFRSYVAFPVGGRARIV
jgi:hypothetical protein